MKVFVDNVQKTSIVFEDDDFVSKNEQKKWVHLGSGVILNYEDENQYSIFENVESVPEDYDPSKHYYENEEWKTNPNWVEPSEVAPSEEPAV